MANIIHWLPSVLGTVGIVAVGFSVTDITRRWRRDDLRTRTKESSTVRD